MRFVANVLSGFDDTMGATFFDLTELQARRRKPSQKPSVQPCLGPIYRFGAIPSHSCCIGPVLILRRGFVSGMQDTLARPC